MVPNSHWRAKEIINQPSSPGFFPRCATLPGAPRGERPASEADAKQGRESAG
jgi:hypothetical protein